MAFVTRSVKRIVLSRTYFVFAVLLYVLSAVGFYRGPFGIPQMAAAFLIVLSVIIAMFRFSTSSRKTFHSIELFTFLILLADFFIERTGGIYSLFLPIQLLVIILVSGLLRSLASLGLATAAALLSFFHSGIISPDFVTTGGELPNVVSFASALILAALLVQALQKMERRRADEAFSELKRLHDGVDRLTQGSEEANHFEEITTEGVLYKKVDSAMELERMIENLLQIIHKTLVAHTAVIFRYDRSADSLFIKNWFSRDETMALDVIIKMGEGPVGWVAKNLRSLNLSRKGKVLKNLYYYPSKHAVLSFLAVPILHHSQLEGVLAVDNLEPDMFDAEDEKMLANYARHMVQLTEYMRILYKQGEETAELKALYEASRVIGRKIELETVLEDLLDLSEQIVKSDLSAVVMLSEDLKNYELKRFRGGIDAKWRGKHFPNDGKTWVSWLMKNRDEPLLLTSVESEKTNMSILFDGEQTDKKPGSFIGIPLKIKEQPVGALCIVGKEKEAFSSTHSRLLSILCNQASYIIDNARMYKKMEEMAITDGLTGLFNHRYFQEMLSRELARAERNSSELALILLDIDYFKKLNDTHGHPAGDAVLKWVSMLIRSEIRSVDIAARYGGEEFAVVLPDTGLKEGQKIAERVRSTMEKERIPHEKKLLNTTLSVGLACYPADAKTKKELIERADKALYTAKQEGRNRICTASELQKLAQD
jgi:diguanylate cyclase (GGDEF)-like protein